MFLIFYIDKKTIHIEYGYSNNGLCLHWNKSNVVRIGNNRQYR